ncbi:hypothetical protein D187_007424 [Cystobacter fuscus DSM 2262]|uniref:Uncharacterized protein n=1 Tax=Cystobacter fuscus (strain ATCC 25194 / DSM 2262 / NBRC 100088 / M29) TaxID=1242864 RepID=S9P1E8_CYSF2|nr:hypothetical protein [Cystobacter fuscus]EPX56082.1 hypothetical protein D187_007424 [Cystobacter fuscus DSM 2262]
MDARGSFPADVLERARVLGTRASKEGAEVLAADEIERRLKQARV